MIYPADNDETWWDWIVWETEGNPSDRYRRSGHSRKLGLYRLSYDQLRKFSDDLNEGEFAADWRQPSAAPGILGGGGVKVAFVESVDYGNHRALIRTLLPCFTIENGHLREPPNPPPVINAQVSVGRQPGGANVPHAVNRQDRYIVLPYNFDDNSKASRAIGGDPGYFGDAQFYGSARLALELDRWASASRSTIVAFYDREPDMTLHAENAWPHRSNPPERVWINGTAIEDARLTKYQKDHATATYYSVKTGVEFVAGESQMGNSKDLLEANSIHAMRRSHLITATIARLTEDTFEARYQIEILSILWRGSMADEDKYLNFDGIQIREIGNAAVDAVWFPALAIPSHGKPFVRHYAGLTGDDDWIDYWDQNFARPMGRAKAEMLCYFGMQHLTSNAQNFLVAFNRDGPRSRQHLILRDIGDTLYNDHFFAVLREVNALYATEFDTELADAHGVTLTKDIGGGYVRPFMTRIGAQVVFFFGPFIQKDVAALPDHWRTIGRWSMSHNRAFLDYMREKIGYHQDWTDAGAADLAQTDEASLLKNTTLEMQYQKDYAALIPTILGLKPAKRWDLINKYEADVETADSLARALQLVNAHETLICAEIQEYVRSDAGKRALKALHGVGAAPQVAAAAAAGPICSVCNADAAGNSTDWHKCGSCGAHYCAACVKKLSFPKGTIVVMRPHTRERLCAMDDCRGFTEAV